MIIVMMIFNNYLSGKTTKERKRFLSIYPISEFLAPPKSPATGLTIREIISKMNDIDILNLPKDANP